MGAEGATTNRTDNTGAGYKMEDNIQSTDTFESAAPESLSSGPVNDTASANAAPADQSAPQPSQPSRSWERAMESTAANIEARDLPEIQAPQNWRQDLDWKAVPRSVQEHILKREDEVQKGFSRFGEDVKMAREISEVIDGFNQNLPEQYRAMPRQQQIHTLYAANEFLLRDPRSAIEWLANAHGVDLGQFGPGAQTVQQVQAQHQQWHNQRLQYLQQQILDYAKDKPHWPEIEDEVITQVNAIKEQQPGLYEIDPMSVLREAEKRALSITGVSNKQSANEAKKKADEAKRLASLNVKSVVGKSPTSVHKDIWSNDSWGQAYDKATRR